MVREVIANLDLQPGKTYLDMTFGGGGHSLEILKNLPKNSVKILALDRDPFAYKRAVGYAKIYPDEIVPLLGKFSDLPKLLPKLGIVQNSLDGILFDFGCSSFQLEESGRGFSLSRNGPLDMRMDTNLYTESVTAADLLAHLNEEDLALIFKVYADEKKAKKIAQAIVEARYKFQRLKTTQELADVVRNVLGSESRFDKLNRPTHVATKIFQALRIFVNNELNEINYGLLLAHRYLKIGGRLVALTFHSLEDTIVKRHISNQITSNAKNSLNLKYFDCNETYESEEVEVVNGSNWKPLHKHVLVPREQEIKHNPRSRSAKLRAAAKVK